MKKRLFSLSTSVIITTALSAGTQEDIAELKAEIATLQEQTEALIEETADIKSGSFSFTEVDSTQAVGGLGDGASKVYYSKSPLSIGGYGEMYWADPDNGDAFADVYRFVPYIGYKFSDKIILNTELEFEHGGDEVAIEFMYLDFLIDDAFNIRVGHLLVPMGIINTRHEPTLFNTVQRPEVERYLLPSTWHENGVLTYGKIGEIGLDYTAGIVNALDLKKGNEASETQWIRKGRIGAEEKGTMNRVAFVGRLDYTGYNGLLAGASLYYGDAAQGHPNGSSAFIYDIHAVYANSGFKFKGLYTATTVDGADEWDLPTAATDASGYYLNAEYDLLADFGTTDRAPLFVQYESYDPTKESVDGADLNNALTITTLGLNFFPHEQVVLKLDYAMKKYDDHANEDVNTLSFGLGFVF